MKALRLAGIVLLVLFGSAVFWVGKGLCVYGASNDRWVSVVVTLSVMGVLVCASGYLSWRLHR